MSRIADRPFDAGGSHAVDKARDRAPGPGHPAPLQRWCFRCGRYAPLLGSRMVGRLFKCASCVAGVPSNSPEDSNDHR